MGEGLTREEAKDIYEKINHMSESIVRIETKLDLMPKPQPRPCETLLEHLKEQKENWLGWKNAVVVCIVSMLFSALTGLISYWLAGRAERKNDESNSGIKKVETQPQESLGCELL